MTRTRRRSHAPAALAAPAAEEPSSPAAPGPTASDVLSLFEQESFSPLDRLKALSSHYTAQDDSDTWLQDKPLKRREKKHPKAKPTRIVVSVAPKPGAREATALLALAAAVAAVRVRGARAPARRVVSRPVRLQLSQPQYVQRLVRGREGVPREVGTGGDGLAISELLLNASQEWIPRGLRQRTDMELHDPSSSVLSCIRHTLAISASNSRGTSRASRPGTAGGSGSAASSHIGIARYRPDNVASEVKADMASILEHMQALDFSSAPADGGDPAARQVDGDGPSYIAGIEFCESEELSTSTGSTPFESPQTSIDKHPSMSDVDMSLSSFRDGSFASSWVSHPARRTRAATDAPRNSGGSHRSLLRASSSRRLHTARRVERPPAPPADAAAAHDVVAPPPGTPMSDAEAVDSVAERLSELRRLRERQVSVGTQRQSLRSLGVSTDFHVSQLTTPTTSTPPRRSPPPEVDAGDTSTAADVKTPWTVGHSYVATPLESRGVSPSTSPVALSGNTPVTPAAAATPLEATPRDDIHLVATPRALPRTPPPEGPAGARLPQPTAEEVHPTTPFPLPPRRGAPPTAPAKAAGGSTAEFPFECVTQIAPPIIGSVPPAKKKFQRLLEKQTELKTPTCTPITPYRQRGTFDAVHVRDEVGAKVQLSEVELQRVLLERVERASDNAEESHAGDAGTGGDADGTEDDSGTVKSPDTPQRPRSSRGGFSRTKRLLAPPTSPALFFRGAGSPSTAHPTSPAAGGASPRLFRSTTSFAGRKQLTAAAKDKMHELMMHDLNECLANYPLSPLVMTARTVGRTPASPGTPGIYKQPGRIGAVGDKKTVSIRLPGTPVGEEIKPMVLRARPGKASAFEMREPVPPEKPEKPLTPTQPLSPRFAFTSNPIRRRQLVSTPRVADSGDVGGDDATPADTASPVRVRHGQAAPRVDGVQGEAASPTAEATAAPVPENGGASPSGERSVSSPATVQSGSPATTAAHVSSARGSRSTSVSSPAASALRSPRLSPAGAAEQPSSAVSDEQARTRSDSAQSGRSAKSLRRASPGVAVAPTPPLDSTANTGVLAAAASPPRRPPPREVVLGPVVDTKARERELARIACDLDMVFYDPRPRPMPAAPAAPVRAACTGSASRRGVAEAKIQSLIQQELWRRRPAAHRTYKYTPRLSGHPMSV